MSVREARAHFADLLGSVYHTGEPVIVERNGRPVAVVVSPERYAREAAEEPPRGGDAALDLELEERLAAAPIVRSIVASWPKRKPIRTDLSIKEALQLARDEAWRRKQARST